MNTVTWNWRDGLTNGRFASRVIGFDLRTIFNPPSLSLQSHLAWTGMIAPFGGAFFLLNSSAISSIVTNSTPSCFKKCSMSLVGC